MAHEHGYISRKDDYLKRLRRIEGQARGLQRMVDEEQYCIDILTQVSAMTKALQAVSLSLLEDYLRHCVVDAATSGGDQAEEDVPQWGGARDLLRPRAVEPARSVMEERRIGGSERRGDRGV